jgi:D-tyrosyl-tRNA(Tyr) deacylase
MRAVIQRVKRACVRVDDTITGEIGSGLLVFLGIAESDTEKDLIYIVEKTLNLRIFEDAEGKMNLSVFDKAGGLLVVSQFTLLGDCRKGRRPSFIAAARPEKAITFYEQSIELFKASGLTVATGKFQAEMDVELVNDGPVTMLLDSQKAI